MSEHHDVERTYFHACYILVVCVRAQQMHVVLVACAYPLLRPSHPHTRTCTSYHPHLCMLLYLVIPTLRLSKSWRPSPLPNLPQARLLGRCQRRTASRSNTGQILGKCWANAGQMLGKYKSYESDAGKQKASPMMDKASKAQQAY
jgi:hypothetical protein